MFVGAESIEEALALRLPQGQLDDLRLGHVDHLRVGLDDGQGMVVGADGDGEAAHVHRRAALKGSDVKYKRREYDLHSVWFMWDTVEIWKLSCFEYPDRHTN